MTHKFTINTAERLIQAYYGKDIHTKYITNGSELVSGKGKVIVSKSDIEAVISEAYDLGLVGAFDISIMNVAVFNKNFLGQINFKHSVAFQMNESTQVFSSSMFKVASIVFRVGTNEVVAFELGDFPTNFAYYSTIDSNHMLKGKGMFIEVERV